MSVAIPTLNFRCDNGMQKAVAVVHAVREERKAMIAFYLLQAEKRLLTLTEALKRIPDHLKNTHPYSANALWTFYLDTEHQPEGPSCNYCKMFDGQTFTGYQLRTVFPDHKWVGDDIYANVHMTLWGKDGTCGCLLIREADPENQPNLSLWSQMGVDWTEQ